MTDLLQVLPDFDTKPFTHLLPSLEKAVVSTNDLLTLEPADVARRAQLPPGEVKKLVDGIVAALHKDLGLGGEEGHGHGNSAFLSGSGRLRGADAGQGSIISALDEKLDAALGGGIRPGYLVEITGESGAGKTQLLLTLLLAAQLLPPQGLSKPVIYISTEAALATTRLTQLLATHPALASLPPKQRPSLSRILSIQLPDLESQDHILRYQLPVAIQKHGVGLVIIDSVAANYRAEFEKKGEREGAASMAKRGAQLVQLGALLRDIARTEGIAIVVANQVADRFSRPSAALTSNLVSRTPSVNSQGAPTSVSNPMSRNTSVNSQGEASRPGGSTPTHQLSDLTLISAEPMTLDHQQRWTTGWGDDPSAPLHTLKTPSLGLVWTNQLACRIALHKEAVYSARPLADTANSEGQWTEEENNVSSWRRWFKVVFSSWAPPSEGKGVEFQVTKSGVRHVATES